MRAAVYRQFRGNISIEKVPDPKVPDGGIVLKVMATGICRSDWHGWQGHDPEIALPHVPGHETAGEIVEVGKDVKNWKPGDRVTFPFVCGCGACPPCRKGNQQVCDHQFQPGFTHWGSFAEYVAVHYADNNIVRIPDFMDYSEAASLGCRFITSFRAVMDRGKVKTGQWVAIHGCGGVGLSAIMIAKAAGARVIAVDISENALKRASYTGADIVINDSGDSLIEAIKDKTNGGAHVSMDALGSAETCKNSILCLRKLGKHVQVGLLAGKEYRPGIPMEAVIANELEILGSHGMASRDYNRIFKMIAEGKLDPGSLITRSLDLEKGAETLLQMEDFSSAGIAVITEF